MQKENQRCYLIQSVGLTHNLTTDRFFFCHQPCPRYQFTRYVHNNPTKIENTLSKILFLIKLILTKIHTVFNILDKGSF